MKPHSLSLTFTSLISSYRKLQSGLVSQIRRLAVNSSTATPGSFIMIQFQMSQVTQIGESISNLIAQVNSVINHAVQNQISH
jgi:hypothetical protein